MVAIEQQRLANGHAVEKARWRSRCINLRAICILKGEERRRLGMQGAESSWAQINRLVSLTSMTSLSVIEGSDLDS